MKPQVPIYQDVDGLPHTDPKEILDNQIKLMTCPVKWTDITMNMARDGVSEFYEVGTDDTLQKIVKRMVPEAMVTSLLRTPIYEGKIHDFSIINN
jgi:[acyl-carrier-protein] S-malonyltransferase